MCMVRDGGCVRDGGYGGGRDCGCGEGWWVW